MTVRILCISFSDIRADARVLRQLEVLARYGTVTTVSYGMKPDAADDHFEINEALPSLPQTLSGVARLALRRYRSVQLAAPAIRAALSAIGDRPFDIVVANEARALPLAFEVAGSPQVWCDLHEWAPAERSHVLSWRLLVAPFMDWVCRTHLQAADATTTVNVSIADMYRRAYGVRPEVVRNAIGHRSDLSPSEVPDGRIRLVHSGGAVKGRNIEAIIDAVDKLGDGYSLDLFLVPPRRSDGYWDELMALIQASERTTLHAPVAPTALPDALNVYDLGVFALPPHTPNHRYMLPNKFFDYVQARLGIVFGPSVETDRLIRDYGLGVIAAGYSGEQIAESIRDLTREDIRQFKLASDRSAGELSSDRDVAVEEAIMARMLEHG